MEIQRFILSLLEQDAVILVRGNHEDLYEEMITIDEGLPVRPLALFLRPRAV